MTSCLVVRPYIHQSVCTYVTSFLQNVFCSLVFSEFFLVVIYNERPLDFSIGFKKFECNINRHSVIEKRVVS